jgi:hypothetical protein
VRQCSSATTPRPGVPFGSFFGSMINVEHGMDCEGGEDG